MLTRKKELSGSVERLRAFSRNGHPHASAESTVNALVSDTLLYGHLFPVENLAKTDIRGRMLSADISLGRMCVRLREALRYLMQGFALLRLACLACGIEVPDMFSVKKKESEQ